MTRPLEPGPHARAALPRVEVVQGSVWPEANMFSCTLTAAVKVTFCFLGPSVGWWRAAVPPTGVMP